MPCCSNPRRTLTKPPTPSGPESVEEADHRKTIWKLALVTREGAEFVVAASTERQNEVDAWGTQSAGQLAAWTRRVAEVAKRLSDRLEAGPLLYVAGNSVERQVLVVAPRRQSLIWSAGRRTRRPTNCLKKPKNLLPHGIPKTIF